MKIGILTFHRAHNYGAVLQCYGLQETLREMGHEVEVINYKQPFIEKVYTTFRTERFLKYVFKHPKQTYKYLINTRNRIITKNHFHTFINHHLSLSEECRSDSIPTNYDVYIIGSDQVWNSSLTGGYDKVFWGEFKHKSSANIIGYAISTSLSDISSIDTNIIKQRIANFKALSIREGSVFSYLKKECLCKDVSLCLDPTLISDVDIWNDICSQKYKYDKYVLIYQTRWYKDNPKLLQKKAEELAKKEHLKIVNLTNASCPIEDFIGLFRYASCVITTSFHAVAFSIIFNRPLFAIALGDGHDSRYVDLLSAIDYKEAIVSPTFIPYLYNVDYSVINSKLETLKSKSKDYLNRALELCQ